ncbi:hypothetical protein BGX28_006631 [Mortierella sp. GBA30]|nr:hypothetical protein BGX28_006631 [Mortierella sp. GBA30]
MSFNLGNNDRQPNFSSSSSTGHGSKNPLQQAVNPNNSSSRGDMVLTPDHPSWHADHSSGDPSSQRNTRNNTTTGSSGYRGDDVLPGGRGTGTASSGSNLGGFQNDPYAPYTGGRVTDTATNRGPFRAGPDQDSFLPPDAVPQGARFDPIVPESVRQGLPSRGTGGPRQPGQSPSNYASGEPDNDDLLIPDWTR